MIIVPVPVMHKGTWAYTSALKSFFLNRSGCSIRVREGYRFIMERTLMAFLLRVFLNRCNYRVSLFLSLNMFVSQHLSKRLPKKRFSCIRFKIPFQKSLRGSILKPKFGLIKLSVALLHGLRNDTDVRGIESQSAIFQQKIIFFTISQSLLSRE